MAEELSQLDIAGEPGERQHLPDFSPTYMLRASERDETAVCS